MESEDLFEEGLSEKVPDFDNEIEEVAEEVETSETPMATEDTGSEDRRTSPQPESSKQKSDKPGDNKLIHLPLARIRNIMKLDTDLHIASNEAVFCVTRATELFIGSIARESYNCTAQAKKKTIQRKDVDMAIDTVECLEFLDGAMF